MIKYTLTIINTPNNTNPLSIFINDHLFDIPKKVEIWYQLGKLQAILFNNKYKDGQKVVWNIYYDCEIQQIDGNILFQDLAIELFGTINQN